jgi:aryl-alcohol dehydrogenase-like predicted oxidoreductase
MQYRTLGRGGPKISCVGLGTFQFGGEWGKSFDDYEVQMILGRAQSLGINFLDTAECYGNHLSEKLIGKAIKKSRSEWIIATKFGHKFEAPFSRQNAFGVKEVIQQLDDSLKALQTENIDLYQFHSGSNEDFSNDELWYALHKEKEKGKISFLGVSIKSTMVLDNDLKQIEVAREKNFSSIQLVYNRLQSQAQEHALPLCQKLNLGVLARIPLCQGNLAGKYKVDKSFNANDIRSLNSKEFQTNQIKSINEIRAKEVPPGIDLAQWALAWCLKNSSITAVIPGCKSVEQVESNAKAVDLLETI